MNVSEEKKRLIVIDANSVIHRAYHALPKLTSKSGQVVNAVYGFLLVFFKAIKDFHPDYVAAAFDVPGLTFRHKRYGGYKAKRPKAPEDLYPQFPRVKEILSSFSVPVFGKEGFEADDIIATISSKAPKKQVLPRLETVIISGDRDVLQLVDGKTKVYMLRKGVKDIVLYDGEAVREKYAGLIPEQLLSYKSLRGDPSDNIPGVTGVGEKTATDLILKFGDLDNLYNELEKKSEKAKTIKPNLKETLLKYKDQAFLSRDLARLEKNVPLDFNLKDSKWGNFDRENVIKTLISLGFNSLIDKIPGFEREKENSSGKISESGKQGKFF